MWDTMVCVDLLEKQFVGFQNRQTPGFYESMELSANDIQFQFDGVKIGLSTYPNGGQVIIPKCYFPEWHFFSPNVNLFWRIVSSMSYG